MEVDEQDTQQVQLTAGQQGLFQLCQRDLETSCKHFVERPTLHTGQQMLVDLKRMHSLLSKHLGLPGELEPSSGNLYIICQGLTSILQNRQNLCFADAALRCWSWTGAFAEELFLAWGSTHLAVRQFLSSTELRSSQVWMGCLASIRTWATGRRRALCRTCLAVRTIQAEGIGGDPMHCQRGILPGCSQAPAISKLILYRPLRQLVQTPCSVLADMGG